MDWLNISDLVKQIGDVPFKMMLLASIVFMVREFRFFRKETATEFSLLRTAVSKLHEAIAVIVERTAGHERRITKLESRKK